MEVFGHEIRNLLILAATEAEMHWRGVLVANGQKKKIFSTNDYVKVADPLRLRGYRVDFQRYPDFTTSAPFAGWDCAHATESLPWYSAYNQVKHNRENEFGQATLRHAFDALAACVVMAIAQFGKHALTVDLSAFFRISEPTWLLETKYLFPIREGKWTPVLHPELA